MSPRRLLEAYPLRQCPQLACASPRLSCWQMCARNPAATPPGAWNSSHSAAVTSDKLPFSIQSTAKLSNMLATDFARIGLSKLVEKSTATQLNTSEGDKFRLFSLRGFLPSHRDKGLQPPNDTVRAVQSKS